jgi:hypothetical protein
MPEPARYRFHPLERRGLLLGLGPGQLAAVGGGVLLALVALHADPGGSGLVAGTGLVGGALALACWPVAGRTAVQWIPVGGRWLGRSRRGPQVWRPTRSLAPPGVTLAAAPGGPGDEPMGVVHDRLTGTWSAALAVDSPAFTLLDAGEKDRRLAAWGAVLATAARAGSPVARLQWIERTRAGHGETLRAYLAEMGAPVGPGPGPGPAPAGDVGAALRASYEEVIDAAGPVSQVHEVVVVMSVHPRRAGRALRSFGRGPSAVCELLRREMRLLQGQLRTAEVVPGRVLDPAGLEATIRMAVDPSRTPSPRDRTDRTTAVPAPSGGPWPMAVDESWGSVHVDDRWHATYWIAEWPRVTVGADFLTPLLLVGGARTVTMTMGPVPPARALREAASARTADLADGELRRRAGFVDTARRRREAEGAEARESELAHGHGEYRFCGYVSVSAPDPVALDAACAELEQAAQQSHLELRRLWGQQRDAFTWTLPLGRGLA